MTTRKLIYPGRRFIVRGSWPFPLDMLRYDCCIPATESDSTKLKTIFEDKDPTAVVEIELMAYDNSAPTSARWKSHLWTVL